MWWSHWHESWGVGTFPAFQDPDETEVDMWELQNVENLWQISQKRGFHKKAGGIGGTICQGTALIHPTCLNVCAGRMRS